MRVSVILPAKNEAEGLRLTLPRLRAQLPEAEVIVVDDGSTDATPEVLARYADRVRVIRQENGGVNVATTTGMRAAS